MSQPTGSSANGKKRKRSHHDTQSQSQSQSQAAGETISSDRQVKFKSIEGRALFVSSGALDLPPSVPYHLYQPSVDSANTVLAGQDSKTEWQSLNHAALPVASSFAVDHDVGYSCECVLYPMYWTYAD